MSMFTAKQMNKEKINKIKKENLKVDKQKNMLMLCVRKLT